MSDRNRNVLAGGVIEDLTTEQVWAWETFIRSTPVWKAFVDSRIAVEVLKAVVFGGGISQAEEYRNALRCDQATCDALNVMAREWCARLRAREDAETEQSELDRRIAKIRGRRAASAAKGATT